MSFINPSNWLHKNFNIQKLFGITMFINYIVYFFIFDYESKHLLISILLRAFAALLCLILIFLQYDKNILYKKLYWYFTLTYCLPFFFTFMTLVNNLSDIWLMNSISATFFMIILLDLKQFIKLFFIGILSGFILYYYTLHDIITYIPKDITLKDIVATYIAVIIIGSLFASNKEAIANENKKNAKKIKEINNSLEIKVRNRTKELEKALAAKSEFLNNISHEIKTPVSGFMAISEGLEEHWNVLDEKKKLKYVKDIASSAQRLGSIIGNLLDLSDFIANKNYVNITRFNLINLINTVINNPKYFQYNKKNLSINFVPSHKEAYVHADKEWISQALDHLFSNALKFTPENGNITISLDQNNKFWKFSISDDGIGIPKNEITAIFNPFTLSTRTKTKAGGRGLGLAICSKIFEAHDGKIWAENNKDKGASFYFTLPINAPKSTTRDFL